MKESLTNGVCMADAEMAIKNSVCILAELITHVNIYFIYVYDLFKQMSKHPTCFTSNIFLHVDTCKVLIAL